MELYCQNSVLCGYADDTSCTVEAKSTDILKQKCEEEVEKLLRYMAINKLSCNDEKTHILVMKNGQVDEKITFQIGEAKIEESKEEKLLGVWVSNDLKWSQHISKLESTLLSRLYKLRQIEQELPKFLLKSIAEGIFLSHIRYALGLYCPIRLKNSDPEPTSIKGIKVIYHDVLRLLCSSKREDKMSVENMLNKVGWLSINQLASEVRLIEVWKSLNQENYCLQGLFEKVESNRHNTRASLKIRLKCGLKSRLRDNSFHFPSVKLWNSAPLDVTNAPTESLARSAIRAYVENLPI